MHHSLIISKKTNEQHLEYYNLAESLPILASSI